jgi:hypothetical protein
MKPAAALLLRIAVAIGMAIAFWESTTPVASLPAWQIAVLPAAAVGFVLGFRAALRPALWSAAILLCIGSTIDGEVLVYRQILLRSARSAAQTTPAEELRRAIAGRESSTALPPAGPPHFSRAAAASLYRRTFSSHAFGAALSVALSLAAGLQALRMAARRPAS